MTIVIPSISSEYALRQELYARTLELPEPERWFARDNNHRWRLASALQKTVRRGHVHCATRFAAQLHSIDPVYAWRRLCVIALEDCFGDPLSAAIALEANRLFRFRQQLGELRVLAAVATGLAEGTKSRALCDSLVGRGQGHTHPPAKQFKATTKLQELPWLLQWITLHGLSHAQLGYEIPVVWPLLDDVTVRENEPDPYGDELIDGFPAAAFDLLYTMEGKRASHYLAKCRSFAGFTAAQIAMVMFHVEGAHLHRYLACKEVGALELGAKLVDWSVVGFSSSMQAVELTKIVRDRRSFINDVRRRILG